MTVGTLAQPMPPLHLSNRQLADLFEGLFRLYDAGVPMVSALTSAGVDGDERVSKALKKAASLCQSGKSLTDSLRLVGLVNARDRKLLSTGETTGNLGDVLDGLSDYYYGRARRREKFRTKMLYPIVVAVLAVFVMPLPSAFSGELSTLDYLLRTLVPLILCAALVFVVMQLARARNASLGLIGARIGLMLPVVRGWVTATIHSEFLTRCALVVRSPQPMIQGLDTEIGGMELPEFRRRFKRITTDLESGSGLAKALRSAEVLDASGYGLVSAGEAAGQLDTIMSRLADQTAKSLEDTMDVIATWLSRLLYFVVILVVGLGLVV